MPDAVPAPIEPEETQTAFDDVADALDAAADDSHMAARRLRRLTEQRRQGSRWSDLLAGASARSLLAGVTDASSRASLAAARLRRAISRALLQDGLRVRHIADLLGVSHQRVSEVLSSSESLGDTREVPPPTAPR